MLFTIEKKIKSHKIVIVILVAKLCQDSHFIFEVITFLNEIQNHSIKLSNQGSISKIGMKNHYLEILNSKIRRKNTTLIF